MAKADTQLDRIATHFVSYLFDEYKGTLHVRRVLPWIGFLLTAIYRASAGRVKMSRKRQITFNYGGYKFKARFGHKVGPRGGIEIIEVIPGRGAPDGLQAAKITNLPEAEEAYKFLEKRLTEFIDRQEQILKKAGL